MLPTNISGGFSVPVRCQIFFFISFLILHFSSWGPLTLLTLYLELWEKVKLGWPRVCRGRASYTLKVQATGYKKVGEDWEVPFAHDFVLFCVMLWHRVGKKMRGYKGVWWGK